MPVAVVAAPLDFPGDLVVYDGDAYIPSYSDQATQERELRLQDLDENGASD